MNSVTTSGTTVTNTTNSQNELTGMGNTTLTYDNNGNTLTDDQGHTLIYDAWNRLVTVENSGGTMVEAYTYDGLGHRITEKPTGAPDDLYYSSQWQVVEEDIANSGLKLHADYVWSPVFVDALILRDEHLTGTGDGMSFSADDRVYAIQDVNYNTTALLGHVALSADANGDGVVNGLDLVVLAHNYGNYVTGGAADGDFNGDGVVNQIDLGILASEYNTSAWQVAQRFVYDAYGKEVTLTSTWTTTTDAFAWQYMYQGGRYDATTGLYDFRNREYSPTMMRWTTQDPMGYLNGSNIYGFVEGGPINRFDPLGLAQAWYEGWGTTFVDAIGLGASPGNAGAVWRGGGQGALAGDTIAVNSLTLGLFDKAATSTGAWQPSTQYADVPGASTAKVVADLGAKAEVAALTGGVSEAAVGWVAEGGTSVTVQAFAAGITNSAASSTVAVVQNYATDKPLLNNVGLTAATSFATGTLGGYLSASAEANAQALRLSMTPGEWNMAQQFAAQNPQYLEDAIKSIAIQNFVRDVSIEGISQMLDILGESSEKCESAGVTATLIRPDPWMCP